MNLGDPRLEELEYLAELERDWAGRTEEHPTDTPRRRLIADLILLGHVNGADYLSRVHRVVLGNPRDREGDLAANQQRTAGAISGR